MKIQWPCRVTERHTEGFSPPGSILVFRRNSSSEGTHLGAATCFLLCLFTQEEEVTGGRSQEQHRSHERSGVPRVMAPSGVMGYTHSDGRL